MRLIDLSQPVFAGCPHCPDDPPVTSRLVADHAKDGWCVEELTLTTHTGSHVDAPLHKVHGAAAVDQMPLVAFTGQAVIADLRDSRPGHPFTSSWLARRLRVELKDRIVLIGTGWGSKRAATDEWLQHSPYVSPDGAEWLAEQKIRGIGIDHYSIGGARPHQCQRTHEIFLQAGIWIVEDLFLPDEVYGLAPPLEYWGLPINLRGCGGSFCRPVLVVRET